MTDRLKPDAEARYREIFGAVGPMRVTVSSAGVVLCVDGRHVSVPADVFSRRCRYRDILAWRSAVRLAWDNAELVISET